MRSPIIIPTNQPPPPPPRSFDWARKLRTAFKVWFWMFTTVAFMLFICEESTQLLGFSRMNYRSIKTLESFNEWKADCNRDKAIIKGMQSLCDWTFILNPVSARVFRKYFDQEKEKVDRELWQIQRFIAIAEAEEAEKLAKTVAVAVPVAKDPVVIRATDTIQTASIPAGVMVFSTPNGSVYHSSRKFCAHIFRRDAAGKYARRTDLRIFNSIAEAKAAGLRPCSRCKPGE